MAEPETENDTLDRLESALTRIAAHAKPSDGGEGDERARVVSALDRVIAQLRAALAAADDEEG